MSLADQFKGDIAANTLATEEKKAASLSERFGAFPIADTVGRNLQASQNTTPDQVVSDIKLSNQTGIPVDMVSRNRDEIITQVKQKELDPNDIARNNPSLARWLSVPQNAALAANDISFLRMVENNLLPKREAFVGLADMPRQAASEVVRLPGTILSGTGNLVESLANTADRLTGNSLSTMERYLNEKLGLPTDQGYIFQPSRGLKNLGAPVKSLAEDISVPQERQNLATDISGGVGQLGAQVAQAIFAAPTLIPSLLAQGADIQAQRVGESGKAGTAEGDAAILAGAGATAILEKIGIEKLLNRVPPNVKSQLLKQITDVITAGGIETAQELTENIAQNIITQQLVNPDQKIVDDSAWREITAAGGAASFVRAVLQAATKGKNRQAGQQDQAVLDSVVEANDSTWLKQNAPDKLQEFVATAKKEGADTVYLPIEQITTYFQSQNIDHETALIAAGVDRQDILAAQATGADIQIPIESYTVALAEHHKKGLREFARLSPEAIDPGFTDDDQRQEADRLTSQIFDDITNETQAGRIKDDVSSQLVAVGQDKDSADKYGTLVDKAFSTIAARSNLDAWELYKKYNLTINRPDMQIDDLQKPAEPTITLSQYTPEEAEFFRSMGIPVETKDVTEPRSELQAAENMVTIGGRVPEQSWAENTRVTGTDGIPATVYRGSRTGTTTADDFATIGAATGHPSAGLGVWLSSDRGDAAKYGTVGEYQLDLRNPKIYSIDDFPGFDSIEESKALREQLQAQGHDGVVIDARNVGGPVQFVAFKPESIIQQKTFEQNEGVERGNIKIAKSGIKINLFEKANLSTFIHESGHLFLEVMGDIAQSENAPQQIKDDYEAALKWLGIDARDKIETKHHEQWARGFESYIGEGKAPSQELTGIFSRFRAWMLSIYKTLKNLNVELSDDVRNVFDRMLATDEEIAALKETLPTGEFTKQEESGLDDKKWQAYQKLLIESRAETEGELTAKAYKEITREREEWWKEESQKVAGEVEAEANQMPVYMAWSFLADNKMPDGQPYEGALERAKLDKSALLNMYDQAFLNKSLRYKHVYQQEGGLHPAAVASQFGYTSAEQFVSALAAAPKKDVFVQRETRRRMMEKYGDIKNDGSLPEIAIKAAHNSRRFKALEVELDALGRILGRQSPSMERMRKIADNIISTKKVRDIQPYLYLKAERKSAREFAELMGKGLKAQAFEAKQRQLMNGLLYDRSWKAQEESDKIRDYANKLMRKAKQEKLAKAGASYLQQINDILAAYQFRKLPLKQVDRAENLRQWVERMQDEGDITAVPDSVIARVESHQVNYKDVAMEELRGVHDSLRNIDHLSNLKNKLIKKGEKKDRDEAREELINIVTKTYPNRKTLEASKFARSKARVIGDSLRGMADALWRPETIVESLDGGESGPWHDYLYNPANDARNTQNNLRERIGEKLIALEKSLDNDWKKTLSDEFQIAGRKMTRHDLIGMALNLGNDGNRDKLMRGGYIENGKTRQYTQEDINDAVSNLTSKDWEMVQTVWDTVDSLWPDIIQQTERLSGLPPEKVEAKSFIVETKDGKTLSIKGGYFPVVYDPRFSGQGEAQSQEAASALLSGKYTRPVTPKGHLKERTAFAAPIQLDYESVLTRHIDDVILDISHREFLKQAQWILTDATIKNALMERLGETGYNSLRGFINHTVGADRPMPDAAVMGWHRVSDAILANTAVYALGFKVMTAWGNAVVAPIQGAARVSPKYMLKGLTEFYSNLREATDFIHAMSPMIKNRARDLDASYVDVMNALSGKASIRRKIARASMQVHRWADYLTVHGIWLGRYRQALDSGSQPEEAASLADKAIRQTQTAGAPKDLSAIERDPTFKMFRLFIGPMLIMNNRMRESVTRKGRIATWPEAVGTLFAAWILPAIIYELAVGRGPDEEDEPSEWYKWMATKIGLYPVATIPLARDIGATVEAKILGEYRQVRAAPLAEAGNAVVNAIATASAQIENAAQDEEVDEEKLTKDTLRAIGPIFGLPTAQLDVTGSFIFDVMTNEYNPDSPLDYRYLLVRRPKEEK